MSKLRRSTGVEVMDEFARLKDTYQDLLFSHRSHAPLPVATALDLADLAQRMSRLLEQEADHYREMAGVYRAAADSQPQHLS